MDRQAQARALRLRMYVLCSECARLIDLADGNRQQRTVESADLDRTKRTSTFTGWRCSASTKPEILPAVSESPARSVRKAMKTHQAAASSDHHQCLRRGCSNQGKLRSQAQAGHPNALSLQ